MLPGEEIRQKRYKRFLRLAIVTAYLLALFWPLGSFFFWIFFGAVMYFAFLAFYYRPKKENTFFQSRERGSESSYTDQSAPKQQSVSPSQKRTARLIALLMLSTLFFCILIIYFISTIEDEPSTEALSENDSMNDHRTALKDNPNDLDALTNLGNSFYDLSQYDSAMKYYDRVLTLDAKNYSGLFNKALVYFQWADYDKSLEYFRKCNSLYPEAMDVHNMIGDCYYSLKNYTEAIRWYQQAYNAGFKNSSQLNIMAYIYDTQNRTGEAIKYYKEALQQDSSLVDVYTRLAELEPNRADWYNKKAQAWK